MYYFLFTVYLLIACLLITRVEFIKRTGFSNRLIWLLFLLKISAGIFIGWMSQKFYPQGNDYWGLNASGWEEYKILLSDPKHFFMDLVSSSYGNGYDGFFNSTGSYWNDLKNSLIIKSIAFCDILSQGNYYLNSLFFNFFGFFGHIALYRVFADIFKDRKWPVIVGCFFLPSTLYFSSGIHKDLVVFTLIGICCYALYFSAKNKITLKYLLIACTCLIALVLIRNYVVLSMIPAALAFILCKKTKMNNWLVFASTYCIGFSMLLLLHLVKPTFQPVKIISQKQRDFIELPTAVSQLNLNVVEPNFKSLVKNAPQAFNHGLLRPYVWEHPTKFLIPLAIELFIYELLFIWLLIGFQKNNGPVDDFIIFGLFFTIPLILFTGYIVPNLGSIVRYRSLYLPFFVTPVLCFINWKKFSRNSY